MSTIQSSTNCRYSHTTPLTPKTDSVLLRAYKNTHNKNGTAREEPHGMRDVYLSRKIKI